MRARVWPGRRGERAALQRAGEERGKEGRRRKEKKEDGKRKIKKKRRREREREKGRESERTPAGFAVGYSGPVGHACRNVRSDNARGAKRKRKTGQRSNSGVRSGKSSGELGAWIGRIELNDEKNFENYF